MIIRGIEKMFKVGYVFSIQAFLVIRDLFLLGTNNACTMQKEGKTRNPISTKESIRQGIRH